jgi:bifunctional polynucleotide phosphatase/kinase
LTYCKCSTGADKWSLQHKSIPDKLQSLYNDGYKLVSYVLVLFPSLTLLLDLCTLFQDKYTHSMFIQNHVVWCCQVIFTNESNIERWKNKRQQAVDSKVGRLDNFIERVKVPVQVFCEPIFFSLIFVFISIC